MPLFINIVLHVLVAVSISVREKQTTKEGKITVKIANNVHKMKTEEKDLNLILVYVCVCYL